MLRLDGKVALVTGVGSAGPGWGNGKAIATLFARQGATIFGLDINLAAAAETRNVIATEGGQCEVAACDVCETAQIEAAVAACLSRFGRIDILVNNVGGSAPGNAATMDEAAWRGQLDYNLTSAFVMCKAVLPHMEARGSGAIVNISSVAGLRYIGRDHVAYSAAKAGLIQFTRAAAVSAGKNGVRMNCVVPGLMDTPLVHRIAAQTGQNDLEAMMRKRAAQVPMGRMGDAWDVAHAVLFLASDEAKYITATEIVVDGGLVAATR